MTDIIFKLRCLMHRPRWARHWVRSVWKVDLDSYLCCGVFECECKYRGPTIRQELEYYWLGKKRVLNFSRPKE